MFHNIWLRFNIIHSIKLLTYNTFPWKIKSIMIKYALPFLPESFISSVLNGVINGLLHASNALLVLTEHNYKFLHHVKTVGVLDQRFHHLNVTQLYHESLHSLVFWFLKNFLNDIRREFLDRQLHEMRFKFHKDIKAILQWPVLYWN